MDAPIISDLRRQFAALHRRRLLIAACVGLSLTGAAAYNSLAPSLYQASASLLLEPESTILVGTRAVIDRRRGLEALNTQFEILRGRGLAEAVVAKLELHASPEFLSGPLISPLERLRRLVLDRGRKLDVSADGSPAAASFQSRLTIEPVPQSSIVNVRFVASDAETAAQAVNTLAQLYVEQTLRAMASETREARGWLSAQLGEQKQTITQSERQLLDYEQQQGLLNLDERLKLAEQKLSVLHGALVEAATERLEKENVHQQLAGLSAAELQRSPAVLGREAAQRVKLKLEDGERLAARLGEALGARHPEMLRVQAELEENRRRLAEEGQAAVREAETAYRMALKREQALQAQLEPVQKELGELRQKAVEHGMLKREAEANQQLFRGLINRSKESGVDSSVPVRNVRVLEKAAVPSQPISPNRARNYQLALMLGLGLGLVLGMLLEHMDDSVRTPDDVKQYVGLPFLGLVPEADRRARKDQPPPSILNAPRSPLAEAYRVIRTNLIFTAAPGQSRSVLVSSVNPAEGKSTTVANLAASLAQNGARVLVVDADLRRPTLHRHFNVASAPGLSELIVGGCELARALRPGVAPRLDVLPCGYVPPNPAELLGAPATRELLSRLVEGYDWVLVDAPPILTIADTAVLAPLVDGVLLVIAAERTARHAVTRAAEQLSAVGAKLLGVVLNRVDVSRNVYYYGRYYGDYYRSYYQQSAERPGDAVAPDGSHSRHPM